MLSFIESLIVSLVGVSTAGVVKPLLAVDLESLTAAAMEGFAGLRLFFPPAMT